jgi:hypothetical protein
VASFEIDGRWQGEYSYDPSDAIPVLPPPTRFVLTAKRGWFGRFKGVIQDDPEGGVVEPAAVRGKLYGFSIAFTKRYPIAYTRHEGRPMPMAEYLESVKGIALDYDIPGIPIKYEGQYNTLEQSMSGVWFFGPKRLKFYRGDYRFEVSFPATKGCWSAQRKPN